MNENLSQNPVTALDQKKKKTFFKKYKEQSNK